MIRKIEFILVIVLGVSVAGSAQDRGRPEPTPIGQVEQQMQRQNDISRRSNELRNVEKFPVSTEEDRKIFREQIEPLYRKPTDKEMEILAPSAEDLGRYPAFIDRKNQGIVKLVADIGCDANLDVLSASKECVNYTMPGAGSSYSFRENMHRLKRLSDINFKKNTIQALGSLTHGIIVNVGDVSLEDVNLEAEGAQYLVKLKPAKDIGKAADLATRLKAGIKEGDFTYASIIEAKPDTTFLLRSIAYRGEAVKVTGNIAYNEFEFDKRRDMVVAFRIINMQPGKSITFLWKELDDNKSPIIKIK